MVLRADYILPLRWADDAHLAELTAYLAQLSRWINVIVVDGSKPSLFSAHGAALPREVHHLRPLPRPGNNGKVAAVMTGVYSSRQELLILADDDVRYTLAALQKLLSRLEHADVVRPQNYFLTLPWHAHVDTARSLINRAFGADYPGTFGVRRSALMRTGGYDGDVLFENLEMLRTIKAAGGKEVIASDLYVGRTVPAVAHFWGQRTRQAYDSLAQPGRLGVELCLLPLFAGTIYGTAMKKHWWPLAAFMAVAMGIAEVGRRMDHGSEIYSATAAAWAPVWVLERAVTAWIAVVLRARGGISYAGGRLCRAANSMSTLQARHRVPDVRTRGI